MTTASSSSPLLSPRQLRQVLLLTVGALALYFTLRWLPTGTNLQHADFRVSGEMGSTLEFCDPANPQFLPVTTVLSPIETRLVAASAPRIGQATQFTLTLRTSSGKPIGPRDLFETHTRKLHIMAVDPTLTDYQHLHPEPGENPGEWVFEVTPERAGLYRIFCDFTPAATGRGLYAAAEFEVPSEGAVARGPTVEHNWTADHGPYRFTLQPAKTPVRLREPASLALTIEHREGGAVPLGEVMGAYAHLVAFDRERTGFAHLHPQESNLSAALDPQAPQLNFQLMIPKGGDFVIWAQVNLDGEDVYVPFWIEVV
jgi:hypothetical protein